MKAPSNLPPGVTDNIIPGNRPEDAELERFIDWITDVLVESPEVEIPRLRSIIEMHMQIVYGKEVTGRDE